MEIPPNDVGIEEDQPLIYELHLALENLWVEGDGPLLELTEGMARSVPFESGCYR